MLRSKQLMVEANVALVVGKEQLQEMEKRVAVRESTPMMPFSFPLWTWWFPLAVWVLVRVLKHLVLPLFELPSQVNIRSPISYRA
mmetsp:Transcript_58992/g.118446  ORF Transcript_58992/g.118446 Transcript_58992/m.118446 type:complete len:85 (+) Transcript_58992:672-926(+)